MINYTERISELMDDIVARVPTLSFLDTSRVLVFARAGRADAEGAYATCHCICLPASEPGYYFWRDRSTGRLTRRSEWFVTKSPTVKVGTGDIAQAGALQRAAGLDRQARYDRARAVSHRSRAAGHSPHGACGRHVLGQ